MSDSPVEVALRELQRRTRQLAVQTEQLGTLRRETELLSNELFKALVGQDGPAKAEAIAAINDKIVLHVREVGVEVSLDDGQTYVVVDNVRVRFVDLADESTYRCLSLNCTHEGVTEDLVVDGKVVGTTSRTYAEIIERLQTRST
jgi:hypothetical protein